MATSFKIETLCTLSPFCRSNVLHNSSKILSQENDINTVN